MCLKLRPLTEEERQRIEKSAHSRTAPVREVERAQMLLFASQGQRVTAIADKLACDERTVRQRIKCFNQNGLTALSDQPRSGRPATYTPEQVAEVIALALTDPQTLDLPFACWTLDRLAAYLSEHKAIPIKRSRMDEILLAEGLRWRTQETWFGEKVDPEFAKKRANSKPSTPLPHKAVVSSA